jgi:hypothetical protein
MNVITDLGGCYHTTLALLMKMPQQKILCLGDINDRGANSKQLIEFLMGHNNAEVLNSNHGHMFVHEYNAVIHGKGYTYYDGGIFSCNGGDTTLNSYKNSGSWKEKLETVPQEHITWLATRPYFYENEKFFFSHAPLYAQKKPIEASDLGTGFVNGYYGDFHSDTSLIWNRVVPERPHKDLNDKIMVFGHNSSDAVKVYSTKFPRGIKCYNNEQFQENLAEEKAGKVFAICLDTSGGKKLTGLDINTMTIYEQEYLTKDVDNA